jgi:hypothetical protein
MQGESCPSVIMARHRADRACELRLASGQKQPGARPELEKRSKRNDTASELFPLSAEEYIRVFQHRASLSHMALSLFKCKHIGGALATLRCCKWTALCRRAHDGDGASLQPHGMGVP